MVRPLHTVVIISGVLLATRTPRGQVLLSLTLQGSQLSSHHKVPTLRGAAQTPNHLTHNCSHESNMDTECSNIVIQSGKHTGKSKKIIRVQEVKSVAMNVVT